MPTYGGMDTLPALLSSKAVAFAASLNTIKCQLLFMLNNCNTLVKAPAGLNLDEGGALHTRCRHSILTTPPGSAAVCGRFLTTPFHDFEFTFPNCQGARRIFSGCFPTAEMFTFDRRWGPDGDLICFFGLVSAVARFARCASINTCL